ncbi:MAG: RNA polymerase sigma factor [Ktedonobacteraceae bacterium]
MQSTDELFLRENYIQHTFSKDSRQASRIGATKATHTQDHLDDFPAYWQALRLALVATVTPSSHIYSEGSLSMESNKSFEELVEQEEAHQMIEVYAGKKRAVEEPPDGELVELAQAGHTQETKSLTTKPLSPRPLDEVNLVQEEEWTQRASQGDQDAFIKLYERYIGRVYDYFFNRVSNVSEAEVLTSETFTRAIGALTRGRYVWRGAPFGAWLLSIGMHVLQERNRELKKASVTEGLDDPEHGLSSRIQGDVLDIIVEREERDALWQLVGELPIVEQRVLIMRHKDNLSYAEIASLLQRSEAACKQLHYRALTKLRDKARIAGL